MRTLLFSAAIAALVSALGCDVKEVHGDFRFDPRGTVRTTSGSPVAGATVTVMTTSAVYESELPTKSVTRTTDPNGEFAFTNVAGRRDMTYAITVTAPGYAPVTVRDLSLRSSPHVISFEELRR